MFSFTAPATTEIYTLSLHDALPISVDGVACSHSYIVKEAEAHGCFRQSMMTGRAHQAVSVVNLDRKSTRLNSSHQIISYAVFCLKKKKKRRRNRRRTEVGTESQAGG